MGYHGIVILRNDLFTVIVLVLPIRVGSSTSLLSHNVFIMFVKIHFYTNLHISNIKVISPKKVNFVNVAKVNLESPKLIRIISQHGVNFLQTAS